MGEGQAHAHPAAAQRVVGDHRAPDVVEKLDADVAVRVGRDTMQAARSLEFVQDNLLIESAPGHPGLIALAFPCQDAQRHAALMRDVGHYAPLVGIVRDVDAGRVTVSRTGRARIHYRMSARDARTARLALVKMATMARAAGAERLVAVGTPAAWHDVGAGAPGERAWQRYLDHLAAFDFTPNRGSVFSAHQMGTARAGADARASACDPWGRVRASDGRGIVGGLYVADTSLFPTALGVNPMVTVMALAGRVAARVAVAIHADG